MTLLKGFLLVCIFVVNSSGLDVNLPKTSDPKEAMLVARRFCSENGLCGDCRSKVALHIFDSAGERVQIGTFVEDTVFEVADEDNSVEVCEVESTSCSRDESQNVAKSTRENSRKIRNLEWIDNDTNISYSIRYSIFPPVNPWQVAMEFCSSKENEISSPSCLELAIFLDNVRQGC